MTSGSLLDTEKYIRTHRAKSRWFKAVSVMACMVVFCTVYALILPAITMSVENPKLAVDETNAGLGDMLSLNVTAQPDSEGEQTVFYLIAKQDNAGFDLEFNENDVAEITGENGEEIELHREYRDDREMGYWFTLPYAEGTTELSLPCVNGIGTLVPVDAEEVPAPIETPVIEEIPVVEKEPAVVEESVVEEDPAIEGELTGEETAEENQTAATDEPTAGDEATGEEPVGENEPDVGEELVAETGSATEEISNDESGAGGLSAEEASGNEAAFEYQETESASDEPVAEEGMSAVPDADSNADNVVTDDTAVTSEEPDTKSGTSDEQESSNFGDDNDSVMTASATYYSLPGESADAQLDVGTYGEANKDSSQTEYEYEAGDAGAEGSLTVYAGCGATLAHARSAAERNASNSVTLSWTDELPTEAALTVDVELSGDWGTDTLAVAETQVGYVESDGTDGDPEGYTIYGQQYGDPCGDWNAAFVAFCLESAEVPEECFPRETDCAQWVETLQSDDWGLYVSSEEGYAPSGGDLVFFDLDGDGQADRVGLVRESDGATLETIEGDSDDAVRHVSYSANDASILGYGILPESTEIMDVNAVPMALAALTALDDGAFRYTDEGTGLTVTLKLESTYYVPADFTLVLEKQNSSDYGNALNAFTKHGQVIDEAAIYKIYLVQNDNNQIHTNLNCGYTLTIEWSNGLFEQVTSDDFLDFVYNKNPNSEPTAFTDPSITYSGDGNILTLTATESYWPNSAEFMFVRSSAPNGLIAGNSKLTYNTETDAFITDPAYAQYYRSNSPIGTAGSFHIVAFNEAHLQAHTNGNVLAKTLYAGSNFGTNNYADELSYIQSYAQVNATSASNENHVLALGSGNTISFEDNGNAFGVNGTKIDKPKNFVQDKDTPAAPLIDLVRVETEIGQIAKNLAGFADANLTYTTGGSYNTLMLSDPDAVGVANYTAAQLSDLGSYLRLDGFQSGHSGTIVINVDCTGISEINMPQARIVIDGQEQSVNEVMEFSAGKVIWNFVNAEGVTINTHLMTGIVLAPVATVSINQNLNGTVVAENIYVKAESHRTDFTGKVTQPDEDEDNCNAYVTVHKIETGYAGTALPGAQFDLYKWENGTWAKVNEDPYITGESGTFMLHWLASNTAYELVELVPPAGYKKSETPYYFWIKTDKNQMQPDTKPDGFTGTAVEVGGTLLAANDKLIETSTSLTIEKRWVALDGTEISGNAIGVTEITVNVWQADAGKKIGTQPYEVIVLNNGNGWTAELNDLPLGDGQTVSEAYLVEEKPVPGYIAAYDYKDGMTTITNTETGGYVLPATGGKGTTLCTMGGLLLTLSAGIFLLYNQIRRRRGDMGST